MSGNTITLKRSLNKNHPKGAVVKVVHRVDRKRPIEARARLKPKHSLSARTLTGGKRPRVLYLRKEKAHKRKSLRRIVNKRIRREGRVDQELPVAVVPVPGLELSDVTRITADNISIESRVTNFVMPLTPDGLMQINYTENQVPRRNRDRKKDKVWGEVGGVRKPRR